MTPIDFRVRTVLRLMCALVAAFHGVAGMSYAQDATPQRDLLMRFEPPRLKVSPEELNLGTRRNTQDAWGEFTLKNTGGQTLVIRDVTPIWDNLDVSLSKRRLEPGETATMSVWVPLVTYRWAQRRFITIKSNDPINPITRVFVKLNAVAPIVVRPEEADFKGVLASSQSTITVKLTALAQPTFQIVGRNIGEFGAVPGEAKPRWIPDPAASRLIKTAVREVKPGTVWEVDITLKVPAEEMRIRKWLRVETDILDLQYVYIPISGHTMPPVLVEPEAIELPQESDEPISVRLHVMPGSLRRFELSRVVCPTPTIQSSIEKDRGRGYYVDLSNLQPKRGLSRQFVTLIITGDKTPYQVRVPILSADDDVADSVQIIREVNQKGLAR